MEFKRWRLVATSPVVNAGLGLALLFTAVACSQKEDSPPETPETHDTQRAPSGEIELPAVWATRALKGPVSDIAITEGLSGILAIAYTEGGLQLYTMEAEPVGEIANFKLDALGSGHATTIDDRSITLFPGVTADGTLKAYLFGEGLVAPAQVDLPVQEERKIDGLCSGPAPIGDIMRLAYWTTANDRVLQTGIVGISEGEFVWRSEESTFTDFAIQSCVFTSDTLLASPRSAQTAHLGRGAFDALLSIEEDTGLQLSTDLGMTNTQLDIRNGLTVRVPETIDALTAKGSVLSGGYPGGVVLIAGETSPGEHQVVFVDPSALTLAVE